MKPVVGTKDALIVARLNEPGRRNRTLIDRVFGRAQRDPSTPFACWRHPGALWRGYARVYIGDIQVFAHRVAYIAAWGPIPDGMTIDHMCQTRNCVDPNHLEAVSAEENSRRRDGWRPHCDRGHPYTPENTYEWTRRDGRAERRCRRCNAENARRRKGAAV